MPNSSSIQKPSYQPVRTSVGFAPTHSMAVTPVMTVSNTAKTKGSGSHRLINSALCCANRTSTDPPSLRGVRRDTHHKLKRRLRPSHRVSAFWLSVRETETPRGLKPPPTIGWFVRGLVEIPNSEIRTPNSREVRFRRDVPERRPAVARNDLLEQFSAPFGVTGGQVPVGDAVSDGRVG